MHPQADITGASGATVIILAAGKGTRMQSAMPKVMHRLAGQPMLWHVLSCAEELGAGEIIVVVGPGMPEVEALASGFDPRVKTVVQTEQRGTGHAVQTALPLVQNSQAPVLVLYGDSPLITAPLAASSLQALQAYDLCVMGMRPENPQGYGRLVLDADDRLLKIVEQKDASEQEKHLRLCNSGMMAIRGEVLASLLAELSDSNASGEFYLTDCVGIANGKGLSCGVVEGETEQLLGANSRVELARLEQILQRRLREQAMLGGVTLVAPETVFLSADTRFGTDVLVQPFVTIGAGVEIASHVEIRSFCHLEGCHIGGGSTVGPYARLRPGTVLRGHNHIGNFVELKKTEVDEGSKINHLSYVGDATIGKEVNIGAGTITCNYDGFSKSRTVIGDGSFIGSNSALVAPVELGSGVIIAAGSTITENVPSNALAIAREKQVVKPEGGATFRARHTQSKP